MNDEGDVPLPYREGRADLPDRRRYVVRVVGAAVIGTAAVFGCVFIWILSNLRIHPTATPPPVHWEFPAMCTLGALGVLLAIGAAAWRRGDRSIPLGLLIGVGVGALCEGFCFAAFS